MISSRAINKILGITDGIPVVASDMTCHLNISFYPNQVNISENIRVFTENLKTSLLRLGANVIPYEAIWDSVPLMKRMRRFIKYTINNIICVYRWQVYGSDLGSYLQFKTILKLCGPKKIKKGIAIVCPGEQMVEELPMQYISSFKTNSIITILDLPKNINISSTFQEHFDTAMSLFAYHMTNIALAVDSEKWLIYNFNASHPIYYFDDNKFDDHILRSLIPKIVAPICPHKIDDFKVSDSLYDPNDSVHRKIVMDMKAGAMSFAGTNLYPKGKMIDGLPFRHNFHRIIGKLHLDNRNGMSFGFFSHQLPTYFSPAIKLSKFKINHSGAFAKDDYYCDKAGNIHILFEIKSVKLVIMVPEIWVITLRSGSDKTHFNQNDDLIKIGLKNGDMMLMFSKKNEILKNYKPSFDTKIILAHAVGNAIVASIASYFDSHNKYASSLRHNGMTITHWHGYFKENLVPQGLYMYGSDNPHVSCSSPQAAIYALDGKLRNFADIIAKSDKFDCMGDVHIEPHHGINVNYPSLVKLAQYIMNNPESTELGDKYFRLH